MVVIVNGEEFNEYLSKVNINNSVGEISEISCKEFPIHLVNGNGRIRFKGCELGNVLIEKFHGEWLKFKDCNIEVLDFLGVSGSTAISIENCKISKLSFRLVDSLILKIILSQNEIDELYIEGSANDIEVSEGKYNKITMEKLHATDVTIELITLEDGCFIRDSKILNCANQNNLNAHYVIGDSEFTSLSFFSSENLHVGISKCTLRSGFLLSCTFSQFLCIDCKGGKVDSYGCFYDLFELHEDSDLLISFRHDIHDKKSKQLFDIRKLRVVKVRKIQSLKILDQRINILEILESRFENVFEISNCVITEELKLSHSNLGKLALNSVKLENSCDVTITNTNLIDVAFSSFRWNSKYMLCETKTGSRLESYIDLRESYRQLKANYFKNHNRIEALEFQKHELRIHYKILSATKWSSSRDLGNYLIVGSNKLFSDFGQNIWKPLLFLFGFHLVLFNGLLFFNSDLGYHAGFPIDCDATLNAAGLYFETLLPTHTTKVRGILGNDVSIGGFLDFAIRILSGYFIFYFISASRKYHQ